MDVYSARLNLHGDNRIDRITNQQQKEFLRYLERSPNRKTITVDNVDYFASILLKKDAENVTHLQLLTPYDTPVKTGTILQWEGSNWIVLYEVKPKKTSSFNGVIKQCNNILKWVDSYGVPRGTPCFIEAKGTDLEYSSSTTGMGSNSSIVFSKYNGTLNIIIPKNAFTSALKNETRFILNDLAWSLVNIDGLSSNDLVYLQLKHIMISETKDSLSLDLGNASNVDSWKVKIINGDKISLTQGEEVELKYLLYNQDNVVDDKEIACITSSNEEAVYLEGNIIKTKAIGEAIVKVYIKNAPEVYDEISISVKEVSDLNVFYTFDGNIDIYQNSTGTYKVTKTINGVVDNDVRFKFKLNDSKKITKGIKRLDNSSVSVMSGNDFGSVELIATDDFWTGSLKININSMI